MLRAIYEYGRTDEIRVVAVNDLGSAETNAHLTQYDTAHGRFPGEVSVTDGALVVNGDAVKVLAEPDPAKLPWGELDVDVVIEATGRFTSRDKASAHLQAGAKKVLISAPAGGDVPTIAYGVNHDVLTAAYDIVSNASCTTNSLAPMLQPLQDAIGIEQGLMNTVHSFTNDQVLSDVYHKDLRRARAAANNIIPTSSGAAVAVTKVLTELAGRLDGFAVRVLTIDGSFVDMTMTMARDTSAEDINSILRSAAEGPLKGVLAYTEVPLVSSDYMHNPASSTIDGPLTKVMGTRLAKVCAWYDNEWGFANRMLDTAVAMAKAS